MKFDDFFSSDFFGDDFFTHMVYSDNMVRNGNERRCPHCGMTFRDFNQTGKFGCSQCYEAFLPEIEPLVKRLQGSLRYEGRVPSRGNGVFRTKHQIKRLRQELNKVIQAENFEEAAKIRDEIKVLENSLGTSVSGTDVSTLHKDSGHEPLSK